MEPITSLLDAFIKLADRIINLEKAKLQDKQVIFNEIIKPLFEDLEPVALNYMIFFRKARQTVLNSKQNELSQVIQNIKAERDSMVMARIKVSEMARQIRGQIEDVEIINFAWAICDFFEDKSVYSVRFDTGHGSTARQLVNLFDQFAKREIKKDKLITYIDETLNSMEQTWALIIQSYQTLKIDSFSSTKSIRKAKTKHHQS